eukprot:COSAG02_NODE_44798_length_363_cov_0.534091_1_plen_82_part_01
MPLPTMPLCPAPGAIRADSRRSPTCDGLALVPLPRGAATVVDRSLCGGTSRKRGRTSRSQDTGLRHHHPLAGPSVAAGRSGR